MVQWIRQFRTALVGLRPAFVGLSIAALIAAVILLRHPVSALVPIPLPPSIGGRDSVPVSDGKYLFYPRSASVIQGVVYRFSLYTHCGLDNLVALDCDGLLGSDRTRAGLRRKRQPTGWIRQSL